MPVAKEIDDRVLFHLGINAHFSAVAESDRHILYRVYGLSTSVYSSRIKSG